MDQVHKAPPPFPLPLRNPVHLKKISTVYPHRVNPLRNPFDRFVMGEQKNDPLIQMAPRGPEKKADGKKPKF